MKIELTDDEVSTLTDALSCRIKRDDECKKILRVGFITETIRGIIATFDRQSEKAHLLIDRLTHEIAQDRDANGKGGV